MIVVVLSDCPPRLRGDLSKWLFEINTNVYSGNLSSRVRDELWTRICENLKNGRATMVYSANNEQHMEFRTHNSIWTPVDFDGILLMRHPFPASIQQVSTSKNSGEFDHYSNEAKKRTYLKIQRIKNNKYKNYIIIDIEQNNTEYNINLLKINNNVDIDSISFSIKYNIESNNIINFSENKNIEIQKFIKFIDKNDIVCCNSKITIPLLISIYNFFEKKIFSNNCVDITNIAKKKLRLLDDYKLSTLAKHFKIQKKRSA